MIHFPESIELFTTTKCNLKCDYCYISKNKALVEYDKEVQSCNKNLVYFNKIKKLFEGREDGLKCITLWGGEPTIGLENFSNTFDEYVKTFPNLFEVHTSSNMSFSNNGINKLLNRMSIFKDRLFKFKLQVSIDGPDEINNFNRNSTTKTNLNEIIINNVIDLINFVNENDYKNIIVEIKFKPTLSIDMLNNFLQTKDDIVKYFRYFEYLIDLFREKVTSPNLIFVGPPLPNFAVPGMYTQKDGKIFSKFVELCKEIEQENKNMKVFKYYNNILWFKRHLDDTFNDFLNDTITIEHCSACRGQFCIDSNDNIHACHRGFLDSNENYIDNSCNVKDLKIIDQNRRSYELSKKLSRFNLNEFKNNNHLKDQINDININKDTYMASVLAQIYELSQCGLISKCYKENDTLRYLAALFILKADACIQDSIMLTGSYYVKTPSLSKLFLNGAIDKDFYQMINKSKEKKNDL